MSFRGDFEHREALLRAAVNEFSDHGYDAASINRILTRAGVSKGQLYHHFTNKEGLYLALVEWMIDQKTAWFAEQPVRPDGDFFTMLEAQMRASVQFATSRPEVERLTRSLLGERGRPIFASVVSRFGFDPGSALGVLVDHAYAEGELRDDLAQDFVRRVVLHVVNHAPEILDLDDAPGLGDSVGDLMAFLRGGLAR